MLSYGNICLFLVVPPTTAPDGDEGNVQVVFIFSNGVY